MAHLECFEPDTVVRVALKDQRLVSIGKVGFGVIARKGAERGGDEPVLFLGEGLSSELIPDKEYRDINWN